MQTDTHKHINATRQINRQTEKVNGWRIDEQMYRQKKQTERKAQRQTDRQKEKQIKTYIQTYHVTKYNGINRLKPQLWPVL